MSLPGTLVNGGIVQHGGEGVHIPSGVTPGDYPSLSAFSVDSTGVITKAVRAWDAGINYAANQLTLGSNSKLYRAVISNIGNDPTTDLGTNWVRVSIPQGGSSTGQVPIWNNTSKEFEPGAVAGTVPSGTDTQTLYNNAGSWAATSFLKTDPANSQVMVGNPGSPVSAVEFQAWGSGSSTEPGIVLIGSPTATDPIAFTALNAGSVKRVDLGLSGGASHFMTGTSQGDAILRHSGTNPLWFGNRANAGDPAATAIMRMDAANGVTVGGTSAATARLDVIAGSGQAAGKFTGVSGQKGVTIAGSTGSGGIPALEVTNDAANGVWVRNSAALGATSGGVIAMQTDQYPSAGNRIGAYIFGTYVSSTATSSATMVAFSLETHSSSVRGTEVQLQTVTPGTTTLATRARFGGLAADLKSEGSFAVGQRTVTSGTTTGASTDALVFLDGTSGNVTYNLPAVSNTAGKLLILKRIDATANSVTIQPNGATLETGATSFGINARDSLILSNDGTTWYVVGKYDYASGGGGAFIP